MKAITDMNDSNSREKERQLSFDIRRSILLYSYIKHWGQPSRRTISTKKGNPDRVEVYEFPPQQDGVYRIVTIGVSSQPINNYRCANWELLFCLPETLGGANSVSVVNYLLDIMAYSLRSDVDMKIGTTIPETKFAPDPWSTRAILVDEARGEAEEMATFAIGEQNVDLLWLVPITRKEMDYIKQNGLEAFDRLEAKSHFSLLDVNRLGIL